jgi:BCD family chlorophyll transporter-like MFS transporter
MLAPFSAGRLVQTAAVIAVGALAVSATALLGLEPAQASETASHPWKTVPFRAALREVWSEPEARRFTLFVFLSMLAYSAQELILEPFAGKVFALTPAESAKLAGLQHTGVLAGMVLVAICGSTMDAARLGSMRLWTAGGCLASAAAAIALAGVGAWGAAPLLRDAVVALGVANGAFSIAAVAGMMQLASHGKPGREGVRIGLWGAAQALAFACGGLFGTGASDLARDLFGTADLAYAATFLGEAVLFGLAAGLAWRAFPRHPRVIARDASAPAELQQWAT